MVIHPLPQFWSGKTIGRIEAAEISHKCTHDLGISSPLPPSIDLGGETIDVEGEEGRAGVECLVVGEGGCRKEGEAELEGLRDTLVDAHDHTFIRALDEP